MDVVGVTVEEQISDMPVLASSCASSFDGIYFFLKWTPLTGSYSSIVVLQLYPVLCMVESSPQSAR